MVDHGNPTVPIFYATPPPGNKALLDSHELRDSLGKLHICFIYTAPGRDSPMFWLHGLNWKRRIQLCVIVGVLLGMMLNAR